MSGSEIRKRFLQYFERNGHTVVRSSSLVPHGDPTLLFTNAGMNQFKDVFLGIEKKPFKRATSSQKCVRAGGKHNDLENVGFTFRHHTFFEMLGNFSFGDYFKKEAIKFAWEFLSEELKLDKSKMVATIFKGENGVERDNEAYDIWLEYLPKEKIYEFGAKDNFWAMGETGPCGPCSEIHYFQGNEIPCAEENEGRQCKGVACECDRWLELWNLVFMQYNRDEKGVLTPLPAPCVDTGMGLERLSAVMQNVHSNYDCDLIRPIIAEAEKSLGKKYGESFEVDVALRVIADHIRSSSFLIADGVIPSNEGRGYVLRKIIRRAIRYEKKLGLKQTIFPNMAEKVIEIMGESYPELIENRNKIESILKREEEVFSSTLSIGLEKFESSIKEFTCQGIVPGEFLFKFYDTYGFPLDLAKDIADEKKLKLDTDGFEKAMSKQRELAKASWKKEEDFSELSFSSSLSLKTEFVGYENLSSESQTLAIFVKNQKVETLKKGESGWVVFSPTPFYAEGGGQVGDTGNGESSASTFLVKDTKKGAKNIFFSFVEVVDGELKEGDSVKLYVNEALRRNTEAHHTATHLLHYALRETLGSHVKQAGSLVSPWRLRFDFHHFSAIDDDLIFAIEEKVNSAIFDDRLVYKNFMPLDEALKLGAIALFDEKYGDTVRVVEVDGVSKELCGGCHVDRTSRIGIFKILEEKSVAAGTRRIEAVCHNAAYKALSENLTLVNSLEKLLKIGKGQLLPSVSSLLESIKNLERENSQLKLKLASNSETKLDAQNVAGIKVLTKMTQDLNPSLLKNLADSLREKIGSGVVVIGNKTDEKASILVALTPDITNKLNAVKIVKELGKIIGGGGGGKAEIAEAGGKNIAALGSALENAPKIIEKSMGM
ncbi:MAG: alanine--tRNA ligase [Thermoanaerobaculaceae bacterium]|nr:alanine--tRNA ligase [Thermoanaerobaculaceae bacterium]